MAVGSILSSLAGIGMQYGLQTALQDRTEQINIRQWERENEYNSPAAQMARLREAGLNPHLAIGGSVANTAEHAEISNGVPNAPNASAALSSAAANSIQERLLSSEIEKNQAESKNLESQAAEHDANTTYKNQTLQLMVDKLGADLDFTREQIKVAHETIAQLQAQVDNLLSSSKYMQQLTEIGRWTEVKEYHEARSAAAVAEINRKHVGFYDTEMQTIIDNWTSEIGVNDAYRNNLKVNTAFLWSTFKVQGELLQNRNTQEYWSAFYRNPQARYFASMADTQQALLQYLPYQFAGAMFEAYNYFEHDSNGNVIKDKNGLPKINKAFALYQKNMGIAQDIFGLIESGTRSFQNIGTGMFGFKYQPYVPSAGSAAPSAAPSAPSAGSAPRSVGRDLNPNEQKYLRGLIDNYNKAKKAGNYKAQMEYAGKISDYKKLKISQGVKPW